jgi:RNA polymerase sigma factor (sigma-70 family)
MSKERIITQEQFDELLAWLDPNHAEAGAKYEAIRHSLIRIFTWRGIAEAEDMADEVINRVAHNIFKIKPGYVGDPASYFYSVGNNLIMEQWKKKTLHVPLTEADGQTTPPDPSIEEEQAGDREREYECLSLCVQQLEADKRELILAYYEKEKQAKIDHRKALARQENIDLNTLRVRVHRIRARLEECIQRCLERPDGAEAPK